MITLYFHYLEVEQVFGPRGKMNCQYTQKTEAALLDYDCAMSVQLHYEVLVLFLQHTDRPCDDMILTT